jgi:predicted metal-dependent hydrolase
LLAKNNKNMIPKSLHHDKQLIPYEIHHKPSVTRRIHLRAAPDGTLLVIAPRRMSRRAIHKTLQERVHKVARFLADAQARQQELPRRDYINGEAHWYMGGNYPLEIIADRDRQGSVSLDEGRIRINMADHSPQAVKQTLIAWYRQQAGEHFSARIGAVAKNAAWTAGKAPSFRLRKMKRTWGSCSAKGVITLNPRLIKTPPGCIDYVIAHELCHLEEMNHGKAFYALQESLCPRWREARTHLRARAHVYLHE